MKNKKIIIGIAIIAVIVIVITAIVVLKKEDETSLSETENNTQNSNVEYNENENVISDKTVNDVSFTNITCYFDGTNSILDYTITNNSSQTINLGTYEIIVKDEDGNVIANLAPILDYDLAPNESYNTGVAIDVDLSDAYAIELSLDE